MESHTIQEGTSFEDETMESGEVGVSHPKIVVCGSMDKNGGRMKVWKDHLARLGYTVINPHDVPYPHTHDPHEKAVNRKFYYKEIDDAQIILVCVDTDYVGFETACEIGYALKSGKRVIFTDYSTIDGIKALLVDHTAENLRGIFPFEKL